MYARFRTMGLKEKRARRWAVVGARFFVRIHVSQLVKLRDGLVKPVGELDQVSRELEQTLPSDYRAPHCEHTNRKINGLL